MPKHPVGDRNFDGLVRRFQTNIYQTMKGKARLAILKRDFDEFIGGHALDILDVGAGEGRWAAELAGAGHKVTLTDVSAEMIQASKEWFAQQHWWSQNREHVAWFQCALQDLQIQLPHQYDVVNCHAVLEWLDNPSQAINYLQKHVRTNGWLSIIFYNLDGMVFKNLLRGNFKKIKNKDFRGARGSLTPSYPLASADVRTWVEQSGFEIYCHSGIRVFYDYILARPGTPIVEDEALAMEVEMSRVPPYRDLGRYIHILAKKVSC